jgi:hypothetical protein
MKCQKCGAKMAIIGIYHDSHLQIYWMQCYECSHGYEVRRETEKDEPMKFPEEEP